MSVVVKWMDSQSRNSFLVFCCRKKIEIIHVCTLAEQCPSCDGHICWREPASSAACRGPGEKVWLWVLPHAAANKAILSSSRRMATPLCRAGPGSLEETFFQALLEGRGRRRDGQREGNVFTFRRYLCWWAALSPSLAFVSALNESVQALLYREHFQIQCLWSGLTTVVNSGVCSPSLQLGLSERQCLPK